ncbi:MAG: phosphotransferase, partial [Alistipes sp.]|nr:phosphotransferase [Candidatus Minthomonas equi]
MDEIIKLFSKTFGENPLKTECLTASASPRRYYRIYPASGQSTVIATYGTSADENEAFIYLSRHFRERGLPVPEIYGISEDGMTYLQEDLGDITLWDAVSSGRKKGGDYSEEETALLKMAMSDLADIQAKGAENIDWNNCYQQMTFDRRSILFDLHYFKYCFLKPSGVEFDENMLEDEFEKMADIITREKCDRFLYRDFQPRNIMVKDGRLIFIDYQGGRRGPLHYDVASFVWQASALYPDELRNALINTYLESLEKYEHTDKVRFLETLRHFVLLRTIQVLAAYGFRGLYEGKVRFQ